MGCDVNLFKVDAGILSKKLPEAYDESKYKVPFHKYVEQSNVEEQREGSSLDADEILRKATTDIVLLSVDELFEIICWLNYANKDVPVDDLKFRDSTTKKCLNDFGFELIKDFGDQNRTFLFALGDFFMDYYNDFEGTEREIGCLSSQEFLVFIDYALFLYATLLLIEGYYYNNNVELESIIKRSSGDAKLKAIVDKQSAAVIRSKRQLPDYWSSTHFDNGRVEEVLQRGDMVYHYYSEATIVSFDSALRLFQRLKKALLENQHHIYVLDLQ
jgi:hypothetical protein